MAIKKYEGIGNSQAEAQTKMYEEALSSGPQRAPSKIEYLCRVGIGNDQFNGDITTDYDQAFRTAMVAAGVPANYELEVTALGYFGKEGKKEPKARASGSLEVASKADKLTDLL